MHTRGSRGHYLKHRDSLAIGAFRDLIECTAGIPTASPTDRRVLRAPRERGRRTHAVSWCGRRNSVRRGDPRRLVPRRPHRPSLRPSLLRAGDRRRPSGHPRLHGRPGSDRAGISSRLRAKDRTANDAGAGCPRSTVERATGCRDLLAECDPPPADRARRPGNSDAPRGRPWLCLTAPTFGQLQLR